MIKTIWASRFARASPRSRRAIRSITFAGFTRSVVPLLSLSQLQRIHDVFITYLRRCSLKANTSFSERDSSGTTERREAAAGDGADSPTRAKRSGSPKLMKNEEFSISVKSYYLLLSTYYSSAKNDNVSLASSLKSTNKT
jgi:hypothetical protein